jgi:WD40 repeat protein
MNESVRHLAASAGSRLAVGGFEERVEIWDLETAERVNGFSTVLEFGGQRLGLDASGNTCLAGAYHRFGVVAYDVADGTSRWSRADIKRVQYIARSGDGRHAFVGVEGGSAEVVDLRDGKTVERLRGVRRVFENATGTARLVERNSPIVETSSGRSFRVRRSTFAILDVAFGPASVCVSEAGGPTRCLDLDTGRELWRHQPAKGVHILSVVFSPSSKDFLAVSFAFERMAEHTLVRLEPSGRATRLATLGRPAVAEFCLSGDALILSDGRLFDASTGNFLRLIPFAEGAG